MLKIAPSILLLKLQEPSRKRELYEKEMQISEAQQFKTSEQVLIGITAM